MRHAKSSFAGCVRTLRTASPDRMITDEETGEKRAGDSSATGWKVRTTSGICGQGEALPGRGDPGGRRRPDDLGEPGHKRGRRLLGHGQG